MTAPPAIQPHVLVQIGPMQVLSAGVNLPVVPLLSRVDQPGIQPNGTEIAVVHEFSGQRMVTAMVIALASQFNR